MSWSDEPENEERRSEWEAMIGDASSTIQSLAGDFGDNSSHDVLACAELIIDEVVEIHAAAGVLHLAVASVVDVSGDSGLVARWEYAAPYLEDGEEDRDKESREAGVAVEAIAAAAHRFCDVVDRSLCDLAGEVEEAGRPSLESLSALADDAAKLVEWTRIYGSSVLGRYRVSGSMPDVQLGGGAMEEMLGYERAEQLSAGLVGAHPWQ